MQINKFHLLSGFLSSLLLSGCMNTPTPSSQIARQPIKKDLKTIEKVVNLLQKRELDSNKTVILFENNEIIIKTSLSNFEKSLKDWLTRNPHLSSDKALMEYVIADSLNKEVVNAQRIAERWRLEGRLEFRTAALIDSGLCGIVNKKNKIYYKNIVVQTYSYWCGPLCGGGGRKYFLNKKLLFEVSDWIS